MERLPQRTLLAFAGGTLLYILLFLFVDRPVDLWLHAHHAGGAVRQWGEMASSLTWSPAIEIALALGFLAGAAGVIAGGGRDRPWTTMLFYLCVSCAVAIVVGDGLKVLLARYRPAMLFEHGLYGLHFFSTRGELSSTPSGHTLRAFSLLTALSLLFPRGRVLFLAVAVLIGVSRVAVTAHYPSDVLFGAFIGVFSALWVHRGFFRNGLPSPRPARTRPEGAGGSGSGR
jgi:membrane-associated phospholipid phosphatase